VASQMSSAKFDATSVDIAVQDYLFRATGSRLIFPGFLKIYVEGKDENDLENELGDRLLPALEIDEVLALQKLDLQQHFTQPPPRYSEASLVKTLEEEGIGRPAPMLPSSTPFRSEVTFTSKRSVFAHRAGDYRCGSPLGEFSPTPGCGIHGYPGDSAGPD